MKKNSKILFEYFIIILLINIILIISNSPEIFAKRFPSDMPLEVKRKILELESTIGIDIYRGKIGKPYSENMIDVLVNTLESHYIDVKLQALILFEKVIKQLNIPKEVIKQKIIPAINAIIKIDVDVTDEKEMQLIQFAKRVMWHVEFKEIVNKNARLDFLKKNIQNFTDDFYYSFESMNYLVEIGDGYAKKILREKIKESQKVSISHDVIRELELSLQKISIVESLSELDAESKAKKIEQFIIKYKEQKNISTKKFEIWLIRQLKEIDILFSRKILLDILKDETYEIDYRYESQELLIELKEIKPTDRVILMESD